MKDEKENKVKTVVIVATAILVLMSMLPAMVSAQSDIRINEIMYNPPGTDADLEWIELYNNDTTAINITGWKFYEADTNHRLTFVQGSMVIPVTGYAIIADNATAFLNEHPECKCTVMDSTFSLRNSDEYIALKNATSNLVDEVTYNSSWGADGNGKTLERTATGGWEESLADGGTPCELNSVKFVIPFSSWGPPVIYTWKITADAITPENVGENATTELFTATEEIDNETYYIINTIRPTDNTKMYVSIDAENEDDLRKRVVTEMEPGVEIVNLTFDPAFVNWDYPLRDGKTWNGTTDSAKVTAEVVKVPLGWFLCLVLETDISYEVAGQPTSNLEKYWISPTDNGYLTPKYQSYLNGTLMDELVLIEVIPPTFLNATDNNTAINVTTGEFLTQP
jgi:hypothetical protein